MKFVQYVPVDGSLIEGFDIFYKPYDTQAEYEKQTLLGAGIRNHLLTDLQPDTDYTIYMQCFNSAGHSENSNIVVQKTMRKQALFAQKQFESFTSTHGNVC